MKIDFWVDPICPFCWTTARWVVDEIQSHRDLDITWQPISLFVKNEPDPESSGYDAVWFTHRLLRVMEAVRAAEGNDAVHALYWELGSRIHHDKDLDFTAEAALEAVGLDIAHGAAFGDDSWDEVIRARMDEGLELVGDDVGTPIIAMDASDGHRAGYFGPVISRIPPTEQSLKMWDALVAMMDIDSFFELKRTRTEGPQPGDRPLPR